MYGLKQHRFITIQVWRSDVQNVSYLAKTKVSSNLHSFLEALGENPSSYLFQLLEAAQNL